MPETMSLNDIQKLQFSDKKGAEKAIHALLQRNEPRRVVTIELQPKPESLNSVNGFVTFDDGSKFFFKAHTEDNEQISEYYNAKLLADAGYPVISARQVSQTPGQQFVLYEILSLSTLFDLTKSAEDSELGAGDGSSRSSLEKDPLVAGQIDLDKTVFSIYENTLQNVTAERNANAAIHQLFHHRLQEAGRLGLFYRHKSLRMGDGAVSFEQLEQMRWRINGAQYDCTLKEVIERARALMKPGAGAGVVGHGDAHNGNVFVDGSTGKFHLFDPAFAGVHSPLLDLVKPMFHNVFARWMYYPEQVASECRVSYKMSGNLIDVEHTFLPSPLRLCFLESRKRNVLAPTIELLEQHDMLQEDWRDFVRSALFCCPFLTVNLLANFAGNGTLAERYPPEIKLLGLCMAIELSSSPSKGSNAVSTIINDMLLEEPPK